jgi:hypothetical protein
MPTHSLRFLAASLLIVSLTGCTADAPKEAAKPKPVEKPEAITGRAAFYKMLPSAKTWAADCKGIQMESIQMTGVPAEPGKAGAWRGTFVSESKGRMKTFLWSADDGDGGFRKGTWEGQEDSFRGRLGQAAPFYMQALQHDSDEAYKEAISKEDPYLKKNEKIAINFLLEFTPRHPNLAWRVLWGETVGTARYSVFVDASTGKFLEKGR